LGRQFSAKNRRKIHPKKYLTEKYYLKFIFILLIFLPFIFSPSMHVHISALPNDRDWHEFL
jgi:hypothetical protein